MVAMVSVNPNTIYIFDFCWLLCIKAFSVISFKFLSNETDIEAIGSDCGIGCSARERFSSHNSLFLANGEPFINSDIASQ